LFGTTAQIVIGGNDTSKAKYWCLVFIMQWKPIANKYRKGMMKSTLQARLFPKYIFLFLKIYFLYNIHAPKGVKERVKLSNYDTFINYFFIKLQ